MIVRNIVTCAAVAAVLGAASPARAEHDYYYGYELVGADVASWAITAIGVKADSGPVIVGGLVTAVLGAPVIHAVHGDYGNAGADAGFRVGLPLLGGLLGNALCSDSSRSKFLGCLAEVGLGALAGYLGAVVIDVAALGYHDKTSLETGPARRVLSFGVRF